MRNLLSWLLLIGMVAGLQLPVLGADPCESVAKAHAMAHEGHDHDPGKPCDPKHEKHCPLGHDNTACTHAMPIADTMEDREDSLELLVTLSLISLESLRAPEAPVRELDKPPLI
jgi:hypothetical protein